MKSVVHGPQTEIEKRLGLLQCKVFRIIASSMKSLEEKPGRRYVSFL